MRTIVDLPEGQLEALDAWCRAENISRAEAVRRAVTAHLRREIPAIAKGAFGLWQDRAETGLDYESRLRREWDGDATARATPSSKRRS